ncbi:MAG: hypothetical protein ACK5AZ_24175 [Bryobacteraceae bacterium]
MRNAFPFAALVCLLLSACRSETPRNQADLEREFEKRMSGVTLVGRSTRLDREQVSGEERYVIDRVTKVTGNTWLFQAKMQLNSREIPVPIPVTILWAGDTPVITLTDAAIPGMGSYTARVLLYRDQYAGTWSGDKGGGQMFGKIVRNE